MFGAFSYFVLICGLVDLFLFTGLLCFATWGCLRVFVCCVFGLLLIFLDLYCAVCLHCSVGVVVDLSLVFVLKLWVLLGMAIDWLLYGFALLYLLCLLILLFAYLFVFTV